MKPIALPQDVIDAFAGRPEPGSWDDACLLLTSTAEGVVDVCMLSRAEVDVDDRYVHAVVGSRKARANLQTHRAGTLLAFAQGSIYYLALTLHDEFVDDAVCGFTFTVRRVLHDDIGIALRSLGYFVDPGLERTENWAGSQRMLADLRNRASGGHAETSR